jgi:hypothetical protein
MWCGLVRRPTGFWKPRRSLWLFQLRFGITYPKRLPKFRKIRKSGGYIIFFQFPYSSSLEQELIIPNRSWNFINNILVSTLCVSAIGLGTEKCEGRFSNRVGAGCILPFFHGTFIPLRASASCYRLSATAWAGFAAAPLPYVKKDFRTHPRTRIDNI